MLALAACGEDNDRADAESTSPVGPVSADAAERRALAESVTPLDPVSADAAERRALAESASQSYWDRLQDVNSTRAGYSNLDERASSTDQPEAACGLAGPC